MMHCRPSELYLPNRSLSGNNGICERVHSLFTLGTRLSDRGFCDELASVKIRFRPETARKYLGCERNTSFMRGILLQVRSFAWGGGGGGS